MKSSMVLPTCIQWFNILWLLWLAKYDFELCSILVIPPLKMLYKLYYVTVVNKIETTWPPKCQVIVLSTEISKTNTLGHTLITLNFFFIT